MFFEINGNNNQIIIEDGCTLNNVHFWIEGNNNQIVLHEGIVYFGQSGLLWIIANNGLIEIGSNTTFRSVVDFHIAEDDLKITIGKNCLFASTISLWTQDWHPIYDVEGNRINFGKSIVLGDHVWVGSGVKILKGVIIGKNSIIGANSVVTKKFLNENIIIAGNPGKIIKRDVSWKA